MTRQRDSFTTPARECEGHQEFRGADVVQMGKSWATGPLQTHLQRH